MKGQGLYEQRGPTIRRRPAGPGHPTGIPSAEAAQSQAEADGQRAASAQWLTWALPRASPGEAQNNALSVNSSSSRQMQTALSLAQIVLMLEITSLSQRRPIPPGHTHGPASPSPLGKAPKTPSAQERLFRPIQANQSAKSTHNRIHKQQRTKDTHTTKKRPGPRPHASRPTALRRVQGKPSQEPRKSRLHPARATTRVGVTPDGGAGRLGLDISRGHEELGPAHGGGGAGAACGPRLPQRARAGRPLQCPRTRSPSSGQSPATLRCCCPPAPGRPALP